MWPNLQFPADLVTFTEEVFNGKVHFLYSDESLLSNRIDTIYKILPLFVFVLLKEMWGMEKVIDFARRFFYSLLFYLGTDNLSLENLKKFNLCYNYENKPHPLSSGVSTSLEILRNNPWVVLFT